LRQRILQVEALLAYDIDFPEEDDGPVPLTRVMRAAEEALQNVRGLLATGEQGTLIHDGALVVFAGAPNAGKSSLFNGLLGESRAIVTDVPGTTRDAIEAVLDRPLWPLRLVDTAGLRDTTNEIERLGIETSTRYLGRAALVLACGENTQAVRDVIDVVRHATEAPLLGVVTKADLVADRDQLPRTLIAVSVRTGEGLQALLEAIDERLSVEHGAPALDAPGLTRARHQVAVTRATEELAAFRDAMNRHSVPASIAAIHVRSAAEALAELIGEVYTDDVLDVVFRQFCVGK
jgi:tRNA modification GTPase